jgi:hypothetical protein
VSDQLALLRAQRDATTDPTLRAALDAAIAALEATLSRGGGIHFGSGGQFGDVSIGDVAGRDIIKGDRITTGDITGSSGVAIGRGAQSSVTQSIGTAPGGDVERGLGVRSI